MKKLICTLTAVAFTAAPIWAQITRADAQFAGLSARTRLMAYQQSGGDVSRVSPLMAEAAKASATDPVAAYRAFTRATEVMSERGWTPAAELTIAATNARYVLDTVRLAQRSYLAGGFQSLSGYLHTAYRARGFSLKESIDLEAELERAGKLAAALQEGRNPLDGARGALRMAYRSTFDGKLVPYRVFLPSSYSAAKKYPLVVLLHGAGGDENNFIDDYQGMWPKLAEQRGYVLASVNGRGPTSGYAKLNGAEQDVLDVLDLMRKNYSVDPARVYMAGHSMGAAGTWRIGLEYRDRFAALVPIAGSNATPALEAALATGAKIPLFIVAGAKDALVPVAGCRAAAEKSKAAGFPVKYLEYPDGDHLSVAVTSVPEIFDWLDGIGRESARK